MPDAVEAAWQNVEEETADELVDGQSHDLLPVGAGTAIVLVAEVALGPVEPQGASPTAENLIAGEVAVGQISVASESDRASSTSTPR